MFGLPYVRFPATPSTDLLSAPQGLHNVGNTKEKYKFRYIINVKGKFDKAGGGELEDKNLYCYLSG